MQFIRYKTFKNVLKIMDMRAGGFRYNDIAKRIGMSAPGVAALRKKYFPNIKRAINNGDYYQYREDIKNFLSRICIGSETIVEIDKGQNKPFAKLKSLKVCRYYVASKRAECGKKATNGPYCKECFDKTAPLGAGVTHIKTMY